MAEQSEITSSDLAPVTAGAKACDKLVELENTRRKFATFLDWIVSDPTGNLATDFKTAIVRQVLFDAAKKGYFVMSDLTTGYLTLVERVLLNKLQGGTAVDGDGLKWDEDALGTSPNIGAWVPFHEYVSGQSALPAASTGGKIQTAHGLGYRPKHYRGELVCISADGSYSAADVVDAQSLIQQGGGGEIRPGCSVGADGTNVWAIFVKDGTATRKYFLPDKATFEVDGSTPLDASKWECRLIAS